MMKRNRTWMVRLAGLLFLCLLLTGCGRLTPPKNMAASSLAVAEDGGVTVWLVESFEKSYYQITELETMVKGEIASFNEQYNGQGLTAEVESVTMTEDDTKVVVQLKFNNVGSYRAYTGEVLFYGTISEAKTAGYSLDVFMLSASDGSEIMGEDIPKLSEKHIIITKASVCIYGPYRPEYYSGNASLNDDGSVNGSEAGEYTYIIMK